MSTQLLSVAIGPILLFAALTFFVMFLIWTRGLGRFSLSGAFLVIGVLLGLIAVFGAENLLDDEVVLPLSIFGAALLVSGAILRTRPPTSPT